MRIIVQWTLLLALIDVHVLANTEKTIFLAPAAISFPSLHASIENLRLDVLSPDKLTVRKAIPVIFPTTELPNGLDSWYFLRGLTPGQRYEVRICWAAVQPTVFSLDEYPTSDVFDTPGLIQSLAAFSEQQRQQSVSTSNPPRGSDDTTESVLFLRIQSAADFYTTNKTLMLHPPSVNVDIILDPFLLNVFPRSLLPTALYLVVLAVGGYFVAQRVWFIILAQAADAKRHQD